MSTTSEDITVIHARTYKALRAASMAAEDAKKAAHTYYEATGCKDLAAFMKAVETARAAREAMLAHIVVA